MPFVAFDVETTDKPDWKLPADQQTARICELAVMLLDDDLVPIGDAYCELIKPDGWTISPEAHAVNGITLAQCEEHGVPIAEAIAAFDEMQDRAIAMGETTLIGFSMRFDLKFIRGERRRLGRPDRFGETRQFDVMYEANPFTDCRSEKTGRKIMPSLVAAHLQLVGRPMKEAHTALGDVEATVDVARVLRDAWKVDLRGSMPTSSADKEEAKPRTKKAASAPLDPNNLSEF